MVYSCPLGVQALGFSWVVQSNVSPQLCFVWGHLAWAIRQSEMTATCAGPGDSQAKPQYEYRLVAVHAGLGVS